MRSLKAKTSAESQTICALGLKVKILVFWGLSRGNFGGMEKPMLWPEPVEIPIL